MDGNSGAELLVESSCLSTEGANAETGAETGDIVYVSVLATVVAGTG